LLSYQMMRNRIIGSREALENFQFVTINGRVLFNEKERVVRIARAYSQVVKSAIKPLFNGKSIDELTKEFYNFLPNYIYLETALKQAKTIVDGLLDREEENKIFHAKIRKFWFGSRGNKADKGNRNVKFHVFQDHVEVKVKDPWGKWVYGKAYFGKEYLQLLHELEELVSNKVEGYGALISFKEKPMIHLQIPLWLYLKHFSSPKPNGYGLFAGFDLNSDRLNVVINKGGEIIAIKTFLYSDVTRPGFPKGKAMALRLNALSQALSFLSRIGVDYVVFEDLFLVKRRKFTTSKSGNRKITRFAKKQLLTHGVIKALRLGFNVVLVNPKGTTNSEDHEKVMREKGFDRHTASAYLIALKGLGMLNDIK